MRAVRRMTSFSMGVAVLNFVAANAAAAHGVGSPEPTPWTALTTWLPDPLPWAAAIVAIFAYLFSVRRVNAAHPTTRVPTWRVAAWLAGVATLLIALVSAIDVYAEVLLSVHMVQHVLLTMIAPPLLALGAPVTLALRLASRRARRNLLVPLLHSRVVRLIAWPALGWLAFAAVMWFSHFSPLYDAALDDPTLHIAEHGILVASAALFWWPVVSADPVPHRLGYIARLASLVLMMPVAAAVGLAVYFAPTVLYSHYATIARTWGPDPLVDQQIGGLLMWAVGDIVMLGAIALLVGEWMRADERRTRVLDARRAAGLRPAAR